MGISGGYEKAKRKKGTCGNRHNRFSRSLSQDGWVRILEWIRDRFLDMDGDEGISDLSEDAKVMPIPC